MPTYVFKGRNKLNEVVVGERVADDREALRQILRKEQVMLTSVKEKGREIGIPKIGGKKKVKSKDLSVFTRQFSVMIDAGLPLVQCLEILGQQQDNKFFKQVLLQVRQDVEEGSTLAGAMARHPKVFDNLYSNMVEAGETGGILDLILLPLPTRIVTGISSFLAGWGGLFILIGLIAFGVGFRYYYRTPGGRKLIDRL